MPAMWRQHGAAPHQNWAARLPGVLGLLDVREDGVYGELIILAF
jgi:hypothetical protein